MKNKKYIALIIAATMTVGLAACSSTQQTIVSESTVSDIPVSDDASTASAAESETVEDDTSANQTTVAARVDSIEGNKISVTLGEIAGPGGNGGPGANGAQTPPEKPEGEAPSDMGGSGQNATGQTPPEKPEGEAPSDMEESGQNGTGQTPPEKPEGEAPSDMEESGQNDSGQTPPEKPEGEAPSDMEESGQNASGQTPPEKPEGEAPSDMGGSGKPGDIDLSSMFTASDETATITLEESLLDGITLEDITEGTILVLTRNEDGEVIKVSEPSIGGPGGMGGPGGQDASSIEYTAATTYTEDTETAGETYTSNGTDENAVLVDNGATVKAENAAVKRESSDSSGGDSSSFYGVGAAMLAKDGTLIVSDSNISTNAAGGAGVFAYGDGTAYVSDTTISTEQGTSGGIHVAGGGTLYAWNLDVETNGQSSAAIRSDRGGGTMVVDGGTYTSNGKGSPAIYTTADITVNDANLTATDSEAVCIEGLNTLRLFNCDLTGNMPDDTQNDNTWTVIVYQSMSGDSEIGTGNFSMVGGSLTSQNGGLFYTTNTESEILLSDVDITYSGDDDFLLQVTGNANDRGWGQTGSNGAQCTFTADNQEIAGAVIYDSISTLDFYLTNGSTFAGSFNDVETWAGDGGDGYCNVYVGKDSTWTVTDNSYIDTLYAASTILDEDGEYVTIQGEDGTVYVDGDSIYTITVSSYYTDDKSDDALDVPSYNDYQAEKK